jgi:hypothetical protein
LKRAAAALLCTLASATALASVACVEIAGIERKTPSDDGGTGGVQGPIPDAQGPSEDAQDAQPPGDDAAVE